MRHKYLVANQQDKRWGLYVTTIGHQPVAANTVYPPQGHPAGYWFNPIYGRILTEYQLLYIIQGAGKFSSASCSSCRISAGNIVMIFPGEWHTYQPDPQTGWEVYWIGFNGEGIAGLERHQFFTKQHPVLEVGFNEQLVDTFQQALAIAQSQQTAFQPMLAGLTHLMSGIIYYASRNNACNDTTIIAKVNQAKLLMRDGKANVETIAADLHISYSWFRRVFKQYTGFSPAQYHNEMRIKKAKELLTSTTMPVKEICFVLDFESTSYFTTFFKSRVGLTPVEYRNNTRMSGN
ncbi:MAG: AraC family transcriptional regulator [Chitinophaga sp.]|uniref:AraC family transcriptional regulator n=1 Tax=Chitinophaga sp. TaxID=1869181 RepID=UPI001B1D89D2|nr:AraC family transcriptional regulator [Chitinophaga sp.]MBO9727461.1 AraC family transcriptional regulator [Chitinophaga sp.]